MIHLIRSFFFAIAFLFAIAILAIVQLVLCVSGFFIGYIMLAGRQLSQWFVSEGKIAPATRSDDVQAVLVREANNPTYRRLDHPNYGNLNPKYGDLE